MRARRLVTDGVDGWAGCEVGEPCVECAAVEHPVLSMAAPFGSEVVDRVVGELEIRVHPEPDMRPGVVLLGGLPQRDREDLDGVLPLDGFGGDAVLGADLLEDFPDEVVAVGEARVRGELGARATGRGGELAAGVAMRAGAAGGVFVGGVAAPAVHNPAHAADSPESGSGGTSLSFGLSGRGDTVSCCDDTGNSCNSPHLAHGQMNDWTNSWPLIRVSVGSWRQRSDISLTPPASADAGEGAAPPPSPPQMTHHPRRA